MDQNYENPALQQEPIGEPAAIIAPRENESLYMWIKNKGRFRSSAEDTNFEDKESNELEDILDQNEEEEEEEEEESDD